MNPHYPLARRDDLVIRELPDEVLAYDLRREKAFCLNKIAGAVWKLSSGERSASQIAEEMSQQLGATISEQVVWSAIDRLGRDHLLEYCVPIPAFSSGATRRQQLRSLGKAAAFAGPLVAALTVPKASAAQSCRPANASCTPGDIPCCKGTPCSPKDHGKGFTCKA